MSFARKAELDDITLVTALLCDDRVRLDDCVAENHPNKRAVSAHCTWTLSVSMPEDEWDALVAHVSARSDEREWSWSCSKCGIAWLDEGACGVACAAHGPGFYAFDKQKSAVINALRQARQDLATERGEGKLYAEKRS